MTERDSFAAEYALGLLEGEQLLEARGLAASDPGFAREVEQWQARLAPMLDEIADEPAPEAVWAGIAAATAAGAEGKDNVVALQRSLGFWKGLSAAATALAASLALVVAYDAMQAPPPVPGVKQPPGATMVAALTSEDKRMVISAAWRPVDNRLTIMPGAIADAPGHSHELWIIPADGTPRSLGLVTARSASLTVAPAMAPHFSAASKLAISVEPVGGSPGDLPTGPVVAAGELQKV